VSNFHWLKVRFARYKHSQANLAHFHPSKTNQKHQSSHFSLLLLPHSPTQTSPTHASFGCFSANLRQGLQPPTTSHHQLSSSALKITKYHLHLVLVILMMDHIVFIELRIILQMDHGGIEARVRVLS